MVKNLPAVWEIWVRSLGWEDTLEGNGNPLQYSCLENSIDRGPWQELDTTVQLILSFFHFQNKHQKAD